jgi:ClpP class serine protease
VALEASAVGVELDVLEAAPCEACGPVAIVGIRGPLTSHDGPEGFDSYDAIRERARAAFASSCRAVVLRIDSPGGDVAGCFELSGELRAMAAKSGKRLFSYADGMACSAGYAIACAGEQIWTSSAGAVGSVGVAHMLVDTTAADRAMGLNVQVITSGSRKADGNPHVAISAETLGAYQATVDDLAALFFALVEDRRGIPAAMVRGYEAGIFHGAGAKVAGLVNEVGTLDALLAMVATSSGAMAEAGGSDMKLGDIKAALVKAAEGDDEDAAEAKKMLAALYGGAEPDGDEKPAPEEEKPKEEPKKEAKAEAAPEEKKDEEAKASAAALARVGVVERELAGLRATAEANERAGILAARTDLTEGQIKLLAAQPLAQMKRTLEAFPQLETAPKLTGVRGTVATAGSRNTSAGDLRQATALSPHAAMLDRQMGLAKAGPSITLEGDKLVCRTMTPEQARAHLKTMAAREVAQGAVK